MVTIFTEDGRALQFEDDEEVLVLGYHGGSNYHAENREAKRVKCGFHIIVPRSAKRKDREHDVAFVKEISLPVDRFYKTYKPLPRSHYP